MQESQDPFDEQELKKIIQSYDWKDILQSKLGDTPQNKYYRFEPAQMQQKYYRLFRAMLDKEESSERCFHLTSLLLKLKHNNYYALMLRRNYFTSLDFDLKNFLKQNGFINHLLELNCKEYQLWTYKKLLFGFIPKQFAHKNQLYKLQIESLQGLLQIDTKNYHVWDYKLWLTIFFQKQNQQLQISYNKIFDQNSIHKQMEESLKQKDLKVTSINWSNCYSLWSYRYNLSLLYFKKSTVQTRVQFEVREFQTVKKWIQKIQNQLNECGWNYLTGIVLNYQSIGEQRLLQIYNFVKTIFQTNKNNRFAGNTCLQLLQFIEQKTKVDHSKQIQGIIQLLKQIDPVRNLFYDYILTI